MATPRLCGFRACARPNDSWGWGSGWPRQVQTGGGGDPKEPGILRARRGLSRTAFAKLAERVSVGPCLPSRLLHAALPPRGAPWVRAPPGRGRSPQSQWGPPGVERARATGATTSPPLPPETSPRTPCCAGACSSTGRSSACSTPWCSSSVLTSCLKPRPCPAAGRSVGKRASGRGRGCSGGRAGSPPVAGQPALSAAPGDGGRGLSARWRAGSASSRGALRRRVQTGFVTWVSLLATRQHSGVRGHVGIIRFFRPFGLCPASPSAPVSLVTRRFVDVGETPGSSGRWRHCRGV